MSNPDRGCRALLALLDANADDDDRFDGALLIWSHMRDLRLIRQVIVKSDD